ncbi:hypothetical protein [Desulfonatronovibrio hydrogenovorans]|uniref:hypothetical protein n=1 Tax=Desulfonatronovibrio hydrogenovorans TaxID=53245 RepID=UPI0012374977|nr:hypothetical protein [Desulfonatronovibrio hydrogenovorans]
MGFWLFLMVLIFSRSVQVVIFCAGAMAVGIFIWLDAAWDILVFRLQAQLPYFRLLAIMGTALVIMVWSVYWLLARGAYLKKDKI